MFGIDDALIGAVAAPLIGGLIGGGGSSQTTSSAPWKGQQPFLKAGYGYAQDAFNKARNMGTFSGDRVADMNPFTTSGLNFLGNFSTGMAPGLAFGQMGSGLRNQAFGDTYGANTTNLLNNYLSGDPSQYALGMANTFSNNPYMDGMVNAASRDVTRNLYENQLPGLNLSAVGSGNMNSSRTGIAEGIMQRGAADRIGDISANLRGNAFNQGLTSGLNQYNTTFTNALTGNNQLLNLAKFGNDIYNQGLQGMYNAGDVATRAGQGFQTQDQNEINADMQAFNEKRLGDLDLVKMYMGSIGSPVTGSTTSTSGGGLTGALGGAVSGVGLFNSVMGNKENRNPWGTAISSLWN